MARRYRSLHFNMGDDENIPFHREHRSKRGQHIRKPSSLNYKRFKLARKYGKDSELFDI